MRVAARWCSPPPPSPLHAHAQAVDASVSLPYWDFTVDAHAMAEDGTDWKTNALFGDEW